MVSYVPQVREEQRLRICLMCMCVRGSTHDCGCVVDGSMHIVASLQYVQCPSQCKHILLVECYTLLASGSTHTKLEAHRALQYVQCGLHIYIYIYIYIYI